MAVSSKARAMPWTMTPWGISLRLAMATEQKRIGDLVRSQRLTKGLTVEELAHRAQVSVSTVQRAENGKTDQMRRQSRESLGRVLDIDPDALRPRPPAPDLMGSLNGSQPDFIAQLNRIEEKLDALSAERVASSATEKKKAVGRLRKLAEEAQKRRQAQSESEQADAEAKG